MGHQEAKQTDARAVLTRGDKTEVVIWKPPEEVDGECALTKIENIKTFVRPREGTLKYAETVDVKILDVGKNHAEAIVI